MANNPRGVCAVGTSLGVGFATPVEDRALAFAGLPFWLAIQGLLSVRCTQSLWLLKQRSFASKVMGKRKLHK